MLSGWTDYPFATAGDAPNQKAPVRRCDVLSYDQDKYCRIRVDGVPGEHEVKAGYVYKVAGRCGRASTFSWAELNALPVTN